MRVVGWKVWYADVPKRAGRTPEQWAALPDDGLLVVMLYYDEVATDGVTRYRRIMEGNDRYWVAPGVEDHIYGQGNEPVGEIRRRYPGASIKRGVWTDDQHFRTVEAEAMADYVEDW